jgi:hypothetical protein
MELGAVTTLTSENQELREKSLDFLHVFRAEKWHGDDDGRCSRRFMLKMRKSVSGKLITTRISLSKPAGIRDIWNSLGREGGKCV